MRTTTTSSPGEVGRLSTRHVITRFKRFVQRTIVQQAIQSIAWVIAIFAGGIGATLIAAPGEVIHRPTFAVAFQFAPPHIWGIAYAVLGIIIGLTLARNPASTPLPLYGLAITVDVWGFLTIPPVIEHNGAATALWAYTALGAICIIAGLSIDYDHTDPKETP